MKNCIRKEHPHMKQLKRILAGSLAVAVLGSVCAMPAMAEDSTLPQPDPGTQYQVDGNYYYEPLEQRVNSLGGYTIEKVSHPDRDSS